MEYTKFDLQLQKGGEIIYLDVMMKQTNRAIRDAI